MQDRYEDALLGELDIDHIPDFTYDISDVISSRNLEICPKASYKPQAERIYASTPGNKIKWKTSQDNETPKKQAKYPENAFKWTKAEKNEFIARTNLQEENQCKIPKEIIEHPSPERIPFGKELEPVEPIKGMYGPKNTEYRRYGPNIKGIYGPKYV